MPDASPAILLVEDSPSLCSKIRERIEGELGFTLCVAQSKAETETILRTRGPFFLAVLDLLLPDDQNGGIVELVRKSGTPSIIYSAVFDDPTRKRILGMDVIDYVVKTERGVEDLTALIRRLRDNREVKVLVVDDSASARSYMAALLRRYMFATLEAASGEEALQLLARHPDVVLVITDYEMRGLNGLELTDILRAKYEKGRLAVIGVSGSKRRDLPARFLKRGADDYLIKPFEREEFYCRALANVENVERTRRLKELDALKNQFIGMAAHDLRTPINGMVGLSSLLLDGDCGELTSEQRLFVSDINAAAKRMLALVRDILSVARIESGVFALDIGEHDLEVLLMERIRVASAAASRKGVRVVCDYRAPARFRFDANAAAQALDNLVDNAVKFSPPGAVVNISVQARKALVEIAVTDQGPGVAPEEQALLFDAFRKLTAQPTAGESGTGLGLSIVRRLARAHGGDVRVVSEPGRGATFILSLPLSPPSDEKRAGA